MSVPIIQSNELINVKFLATNVGYISYIEIKLEPHITPEHFLKFFTVL